jgi:inosose dehydratase
VRNPNLPPWQRVLDEAAEAGYGGLELGRYGYVPLDLDLVSEALSRRGLFIVAGTIFDDLVSPANRDNLLRQTTRSAPLSRACRSPSSFRASATPPLT